MLADWMQLRGGEGQGLTKSFSTKGTENTIDILDIWSKFTTLCDRLWVKHRLRLGDITVLCKKAQRLKKELK